MPAKKTPATAEKSASVKDAASLLPVVQKTLKASRAQRDGAKEKLDKAVEALKAVQAQDSRITSAINLLTELVEDSNVTAGAEDAALRDLETFFAEAVTDPVDPAE